MRESRTGFVTEGHTTAILMATRISPRPEQRDFARHHARSFLRFAKKRDGGEERNFTIRSAAGGLRRSPHQAAPLLLPGEITRGL